MLITIINKSTIKLHDKVEDPRLSFSELRIKNICYALCNYCNNFSEKDIIYKIKSLSVTNKIEHDIV